MNAAKLYHLSERLGREGRGEQSSFAFKAMCNKTACCRHSCFWQGKNGVVLHYHWKILTKLCYRLFIKTLKFSPNHEKNPHLPVALVILKTLISFFRCVWLGLELNSTGQRHTRTDVAYPCPKASYQLVENGHPMTHLSDLKYDNALCALWVLINSQYASNMHAC